MGRVYTWAWRFDSKFVGFRAGMCSKILIQVGSWDLGWDLWFCCMRLGFWK